MHTTPIHGYQRDRVRQRRAKFFYIVFKKGPPHTIKKNVPLSLWLIWRVDALSVVPCDFWFLIVCGEDYNIIFTAVIISLSVVHVRPTNYRRGCVLGQYVGTELEQLCTEIMFSSVLCHTAIVQP